MPVFGQELSPAKLTVADRLSPIDGHALPGGKLPRAIEHGVRKPLPPVCEASMSTPSDHEMVVFKELRQMAFIPA
jgi:hypothetical protein